MKCAFYEREITPPLGYEMPGHFKKRFSTDIMDKLYVKAMVTESDGKYAAVASAEILQISLDVQNKVVERVEKYTDLTSDCILVCATHSHTACPYLPNTPEDENFVNYLILNIADTIILAYKRLSELTPCFGKGEVNGISFYRNYFRRDMPPKTNPVRNDPAVLGPCDEIEHGLPILCFKDEAGKPVGALISFACHHDTIGGTKVSGDYSCILAKELKKVYGPDFICVFVPGASGNINHYDISKPEEPADHYRFMGKKIAEEAVRVIEAAKPLKSHYIATKYEIFVMPKRKFTPEQIQEARDIIALNQAGKYVRVDSEDFLPEFSEILIKALSLPEEYTVPIMIIKIGELAMHCLPAESSNYFGRQVVENSPFELNMAVAYANNSCLGYIITRDIDYPTVYEASAGSNILGPEAGYVIADKLIALAKTF